ncbi:glutathione S-transferase family protein [Planctomycetales bacterium ZRK34]|nr:glutathione S-transferase family protein [Planctomycetales bacterium ZRK34]
MSEITVYGLSVSPFVRKVMVVCAEKGLKAQNISVSPRSIPDELKVHSPLSKIPFAQIRSKWLADSSIICQYIEAIEPSPSLYPAEAYDRARALWFEEYIDSGAIPNVRQITFQRLVNPLLLGVPSDESVVAETVANDLPPLLDYLEGEIGDREFYVGDQLSIADIAVASFLANIMHARVDLDAARWPNVIRHRDAMWQRPSFAKLIEQETHTLKALADQVAAAAS